MRRWIIGGAVLLLAGCNPVQSLSGPAPAGALACSLRVLSGLEYTPARGGVNDGFIVFERTRAAGLLGSKQVTERITVTEANSQLRLSIVAADEKNKQQKAHRQTTAHGEAVMSGCGNPQTGT